MGKDPPRPAWMLGRLAVRKGVLSDEDLKRCLKIQRDLRRTPGTTVIVYEQDAFGGHVCDFITSASTDETDEADVLTDD